MALVKYGGGITSMSGKMAGNVFAHNRNGNYVRAGTKPVNPNTTQQSVCRSIIQQLTAHWHTTVTPAERIAWATYANAIAMKNRLGETTYLTGFNHFIRYNAIALRQTGVIITAGPTTLALPGQDSTVSVVASAAAQTLAVSYDATLPWQAIPGSKMVCSMGQPQLATRNFFAGPWKLAGGISIGNANPKLIAAPFTLILGQKIWMYERIMTGPLDARLTEPKTFSTTVVA